MIIDDHILGTTTLITSSMTTESNTIDEVYVQVAAYGKFLLVWIVSPKQDAINPSNIEMTA